MEDILYERSGPLAWITIDRPPMNPLRARTWNELAEALDTASTDEAVRVVALTGTGERAFSVGADLKEMPELDSASSFGEAQELQQFLRRLELFPKPTIAAVQGYALGGGCEIAVACTFRIVADSARLGIPEINLSLVPALGACQRLVRLIGRARAAELVLTGQMIDAQEAYRVGLATRVVSVPALHTTVEEFAEALAGKSPTVLALSLAALNANQEASAAASDVLTAALFAVSMQNEEGERTRRQLHEKSRRPN